MGSKIYADCPPPFTLSDTVSTLYVVGDSHVLPLAWRQVTFPSGTTCNIQPVLITGLKIWHLRKDSLFYTKTQFNKAVASIPSGSTVMFAFGEIDCREGIIRAVQKCAYDTMEDGLLKLADIYAKVLLDVQKKYKFRVF